MVSALPVSNTRAEYLPPPTFIANVHSGTHALAAVGAFKTPGLREVDLVAALHRMHRAVARVLGGLLLMRRALDAGRCLIGIEDNKPEAEARIHELMAGNDLLVLARYMQVLSEEFVQRYPNRVINIHHSFLPAFETSAALEVLATNISGSNQRNRRRLIGELRFW